MLDLIRNLFGDPNERALKKVWPIVDEINEQFEGLQNLSDDELKAKTADFKQRIRDAVDDIEADQEEIHQQLRRGVPATDVEGNGAPGQAVRELTLEERRALYEELDQLEEEWLRVVNETLDAILPEAFAVIKETCRRFIGKEWEAGGARIHWDMVPFDVQLLGGIVLHRGRIAEMKTGEGKTLVAVAPMYLNALVGRGVHIVTVNPYLAQRDSEWMGPIFQFHGLEVDCIDKHEPHSPGRRKAYRADITYGTNSEFGFDYLRDNSFVIDPVHLVQRGHHYAIVDEVDSVLIDEARTPLIISGPVPKADAGKYEELKPSVEKLVYAQQKLVGQLAAEGERLLKERDQALEAGDQKKASELESDAGLALFRASRGFPRNKRLLKLKAEPGVGQLIQKTEYFYLQDNAKNMPFVDEELYFALEEKQHALEMTEKGREFIANLVGEDADFFVIPDMGEEIARIDAQFAQKREELRASLEADESLTEEKREHKLQNDLRLIEKEHEETKRQLYNKFSERSDRIHSINQLLKAYTLYEKDDEYIVQDGKVQIVDEHTGRVLSGRRYSDGLHQAIEAKENVKVEAATQTYATITLQNYFRLYDKLAGMTGTAETEAEEFFKIYKLEVNVIPTHKPVARADKDDLVYRSKREKYNAAIDTIRGYHEKGQPVLVGTTSVEVSETLSRMLKRQGIKHNVLNAKADRAKTEALIVAEAGQKGAVTIATNMAGRGTDIKLGNGVREAGGLAILGTERHESRRIDLQLRGRAGRQGDPGESQFYVSLEDDLMRLFGSDRTARVMDRLGLKEGEVIQHPWVTKSIQRAQKKVEQNNFSIRKRQLEYDDVLNAQRQVIYDRRTHALKGERLRGDVLDMLQETIQGIVNRHYGEGEIEGMREEILRTLAFDFNIEREEFVRVGEDGVADQVYQAAVAFYQRKRDGLASPFIEGVKRLMQSDIDPKPETLYVDFTDGRRLIRAASKVSDVLESEGHELNDALERSAMLLLIDEKWTEHLRDLDEIKEGIGLRAYGQRDPLLEYKMEAFKLFSEMISDMNREVVSMIFKAGPLVDAKEERGRAPVRGRSASQRPKLDPSRATASHAAQQGYGVGASMAGSNPNQRTDPTAKAQPVVVGEHVGRNDPCPCGSGKKYKHCHGRAA